MFSLESRRYIGSKAKLTDWIMEVISNYAVNVHTFCDIFAGTAIVAKQAIKTFDHVIINDFLLSNNIIYKAFFGSGEWDSDKLKRIIEEYNALDGALLQDNYFSINYGGKYFELNVSRQIGFIRDNIENRRKELTDKEYCVLLASLIYSMDKIANTIGHYEAYIKKAIPPRPLNMQLIDAQICDNVDIFKSDSNELVREINADVFYVDPPYNSRQYSRFYHVYETLIHWDNRELYGVAMKPKTENMSSYCSSKAAKAFEDLIQNINARYIFVSYNNTYHSRSKSSQNKITLEQIKSILDAKGRTTILEHSHQFFNAGKTDFKDHKELLFVTEVDG